MARRLKRAKNEDVKRNELHRNRCNERHPMWFGVRCERRQDTEHYVHTGEDRTFEWVAKK